MRPMSDRTLGLLAFLQRAVGLYPRGRTPLTDVSRRANRILQDLSQPADSLRFGLALAHLRHQWDLLTDEAANFPEALQLQVRLLELCPTIPATETACQELFEGPLSRLLAAILAQGWKDGASSADIRFASSLTTVRYLVDDVWIDAMTIPATLNESLRGKLRLLSTTDFSMARPHFPPQMKLPNGVEFDWVDGDRLKLRFA